MTDTIMPLLSLAPAAGLLTEAKLTGTRWRMGVSGRGELTGSFYFGADGRIKVFKSFNEASWRLTDGVLEIFDEAGTLAWRFELMFHLDGDEGGQVVLVSGHHKWTPDVGVSLYLLEHRQVEAVAAPVVVEEAAPVDPAAGPEAVRLVIWDLDDTFWQGTLSEGAVLHNARNAAIVDALNRRGIVSAICSKNDHAPVEAELRRQGLWEKFVFPQVAFAPKGAMVAQIIKDSQLRAPTVMFVDDNVTNLNEALYYSPGLQIAEPDFLDQLLDDPRFKGKPDPELTRLARYKVLERKLADQAEQAAASAGTGGSDNRQFLRASKIRISIHADIDREFVRVHDLVNRTNQLNFTKNRWPEDLEEARARFKEEQGENFYGHAGYVKVSDQYGNYGICGFFLVTGDVCKHFLFSCRAMNMGVEQFVWARIGRPYVPVQGDVISDIDMPVDWIAVVEDADVAVSGPTGATKTMTVCIRGACDMTMTSNFLRTQVDTIEELTFAYQGWEICSLPRIVALREEMTRPKNREIVARLPGMPPGRFDSDLMDGKADAYVLSFSQESFQGLYQSRSTGMIIPMGHFGLWHYEPVKQDYTSLPYAAITERGIDNISEAQWNFFREEFIFRGGFNEALFMMDVIDLFTLLHGRGKQVVIIGLNSEIGRDQPILEFFAKINAIVRPLVKEFDFDYVDVNDFIKTEADLAADGHFGGPHFNREIYLKIAEAILARLRPVELPIADAA